VKLVSGTAAATLSGNVHMGARLFAFLLDTPLCLTDAGVPIIYDDPGLGIGAQTYYPACALIDGAGTGAVELPMQFPSTLAADDYPAVKRGRSRLALSVAPDDVEITLSLGALANGDSVRLAATQGAFDGRRVRVLKLFSTWFAGDTTTGPVLDVDGPGYVADVSSAELRLVVKARTDLLSRPLPPRIIEPGCQWMLYGPGCDAALVAHSQARTITTGSTVTSLQFTEAPTTVNVGGLVWFTGGKNKGIQRNVQALAGTGVVVSVPLPYLPIEGDAVVVARGCDRTRATCSNVFSNLPNFGGEPDCPETVPKVVAT
jgi:uncharacterized phage protein (TIGR02218 family)